MKKVFIVSASSLMRSGLENILSARDVQVVGSVADVEQLVERLGEVETDVVLMETSGEQVEDVLEAISEENLAARAAIVLLTADVASGWVAEALRAGVSALLPAEASPDQLAAAIDAASAGLITMHREQMAWAKPTAGSSPSLAELTETLTRREREVLQMLAIGVANKEIATRLKISEHTVKFHVASILGKLGAGSRTEAVAIGIRHGLVLL